MMPGGSVFVCVCVCVCEWACVCVFLGACVCVCVFAVFLKVRGHVAVCFLAHEKACE